jgi:hypothetical protein
MGSIGFIELAGVSALAAVLTLAPQNAARNAQNPQNPRQERAAAQDTTQRKMSSDEVTVTGCLTASARGDRFVLTPLKKDPLAGEMTTRTTDVVPTYTYELRGGSGTNLRAHIGQQVSVTGVLDRNYEKDTDIDRDEETQVAPARPGDPKPTVETEEKAELELRRLQVKTVKSIGKPCDTPSSL